MIRRFWAVFVSAVIISSAAFAQIPTDGLVAFYPLDGNANDTSGNQLNGTAFSVTATTNRFGQADAALLFDGENSYIDCGNPAAFNFEGSFTISAWVKANGSQVNKYIVAKYDFPNSTHSYGLGTANGIPYGFVLGEGPGYTDLFANVALADQWRSLTFVYDKTNGVRLYVDGVNRAQAGGAGLPAFVNSVPLTIGRTFSGQPFGGVIDDVRLYNRALTDAEISTLGPPPELHITTQPNGYYLGLGGRVTLRVTAAVTGTSEPVLYQWFRNGEALLDMTDSTILVTSAEAREDIYKVRVSVGALSEMSNEAKVTFAIPGTSGLLAHYTFENDLAELVVDDTGNYSGVPHGVQYGPGRIGAKSLRLTGTNSFVQIPYPASPLDLAGTPYTIAWWMKMEFNFSNPTQQILSMADTADNLGGYAFHATSTSFTWTHNAGVTGSAMTGQLRGATNWIHVALVWNGFTRTLYTNGVAATVLATTNAIISERNDDLIIGSRNGASPFFQGYLDDLRFYNYALASDEIAQLKGVETVIALSISRRANDLLFTWPFVDVTYSYRVEYTAELGAGAQWSVASGVPQRTGDTVSLAQPFPSGSRFYRLRRL